MGYGVANRHDKPSLPSIGSAGSCRFPAAKGQATSWPNHSARPQLTRNPSSYRRTLVTGRSRQCVT